MSDSGNRIDSRWTYFQIVLGYTAAGIRSGFVVDCVFRGLRFRVQGMAGDSRSASASVSRCVRCGSYDVGVDTCKSLLLLYFRSHAGISLSYEVGKPGREELKRIA